jgi:hypothetical protein
MLVALGTFTGGPSHSLCGSRQGQHSPSPSFRGEREGPGAKRWEGEVGSAADQIIGPPHPTLSPRPAGGEERGEVRADFVWGALRERGRVRVGAKL